MASQPKLVGVEGRSVVFDVDGVGIAVDRWRRHDCTEQCGDQRQRYRHGHELDPRRDGRHEHGQRVE